MPDSLRTEGARALDAASDADRDAKIEQLLLDGLDEYFAGRYADAINIWTRALFFDRSQPRARAYIDRARSALAERARRAEQLLHDGAAAFSRGEADAARQLLTAALEHGAPRDEVLALLGRLERLDPRQPAAVPVQAPRVPRPATVLEEGLPQRGSRRVAATVLIGATIVIAAIVTAASWERLARVLVPADGSAAVAMPPIAATMPAAPRRAELAIARARTLASGGHLRDALAALGEVGLTDPLRGDADRLQGELQRQLLGISGTDAQGAGSRP